MTAANYDASLTRLLVHEGGYTNHPSDPGGPTNYGITIHDYRKYIDAGGTAADVRAMTVAQAKLIYRQRYWSVQRCDELPAGVDYAIFDYGVNSGIGRSGKVLRRLLGRSDATSAITDDVIAAAGKRDPKVLAAAICDERLAFLRSLRTWPTFGRGWARRVAEVRAAALAMAGKTQAVTPAPASPSVAGTPSAIPAGAIPASAIPPWLARMNAILGLYEFRGGADNPAIIAMAKACGGSIAREYKHDAIPWCALTVNYVLIASGLAGNGSLWALDFARYGKRLAGAAVGAIASKKRNGGGHVFLVVGRSKDGMIVGRGGNQSDMVCDQLFDPDDIVAYSWPSTYPLPAKQGFAALPIVAPAPKANRDIVLPAPSKLELPGKGVVPAPSIAKPIVVGTGAAGTAGAADAEGHLGLWVWAASHPIATAVIVAGGVIVIGGVAYAVSRWHKATFDQRQDAPTPGLVLVAV